MKKTSGFIAEFKTFIMRGNVLDLAVGVIIGGAFQAIVNSLVNDVISPLLTLITKGINFADKFIVISLEEGIQSQFKTAQQAMDAGYATFNYGSLVNAVLNFLIMAFVVFLIVKGINKVTALGKKPAVEEEPAPTTKICPFCKSEISIEATKCPHCTSDIPKEKAEA